MKNQILRIKLKAKITKRQIYIKLNRQMQHQKYKNTMVGIATVRIAKLRLLLEKRNHRYHCISNAVKIVG
jgi:hypothetical protein